ncbi:MAG: CPBP family intramembrane glutamic endopeptidase [Erysipelotrichaceae bacterium]|jgi:membrane protease YdiL (CAAX protease family)
MKNIKRLSFIAILFMTAFSLLNIFDFSFKTANINFASLTLLIGITMYFITFTIEKSADLLNFKMIPIALKDKKIIILCLMPVIVNIICLTGAKIFVPEFITHLKGRTVFLAFNQILLLIIQLVIAAVGEEIAWRAFFQNRLTESISFVPALIVSSALFTICHITNGTLSVVLYDLLFIFINALFYGIIFRKTGSAFVSALTHFLANLSGIMFIMFL